MVKQPLRRAFQPNNEQRAEASVHSFTIFLSYKWVLPIYFLFYLECHGWNLFLSGSFSAATLFLAAVSSPSSSSGYTFSRYHLNDLHFKRSLNAFLSEMSPIEMWAAEGFCWITFFWKVLMQHDNYINSIQYFFMSIYV